MSADTSDKSSRKHKSKKAPAGEQPVEDTAVQEAPKKSKKSKKARADSPAADETTDTHTGTGPAGEAAAPKQEKKHKKRKHAEDDGERVERVAEEPKQKKSKKRGRDETATAANDEESGAAVAEPDEQPATSDEKAGKKKRKDKKEKVKEAEAAASAGEAADADGGADSAAQSEVRPQKKDKKKDKKKRKRGEREDAEDQAKDEDAAASSSKPQKKRKRRATESGFPDPTEDESLSEQAQKALHYAFTQFEEPGSWKFNKARQNWIIRNVWSEEAIPEAYIPLVTRYLQGVQGGAREALIKSCQEAIKPAQTQPDTVETEQSKSADTDDAQTESPSKRTVKFTVPDPQSNDSIGTDATKRRRAEALLTVLTSSTTSS